MHILWAKDRAATPWKNGGGTTSEVIVHPPRAGFDDFGWRISIAKVEKSGPFSTFAGIDRNLAMLEGSVLLKLAGRDAIKLSPDAQPVNFPGDVSAEAEVIHHPATDLNVMTRRGLFSATMTRRTLSGEINTDASVTLVFPLGDAMIDEGEHALSLGDAIFAESRERFRLSPATQCYWIQIDPMVGDVGIEPTTR